MPSRKVKTLMRNPKMRKHREHRSRKGRHPRGKGKNSYQSALAHKQRLEEVRIEELEKELKDINL